VLARFCESFHRISTSIDYSGRVEDGEEEERSTTNLAYNLDILSQLLHGFLAAQPRGSLKSKISNQQFPLALLASWRFNQTVSRTRIRHPPSARSPCTRIARSLVTNRLRTLAIKWLNLKRVGQQELVRGHHINGHIINKYAILLSEGYDGAVVLSENRMAAVSPPISRPSLSGVSSQQTCTRRSGLSATTSTRSHSPSSLPDNQGVRRHIRQPRQHLARQALIRGQQICPLI
jgi:hypothetical protein